MLEFCEQLDLYDFVSAGPRQEKQRKVWYLLLCLRNLLFFTSGYRQSNTEGRVICRSLQDDHVIVYEPEGQNSFELKIQSSLCPHLSPLQATINEANDTFESFIHPHMCIAHSLTLILSIIKCWYAQRDFPPFCHAKWPRYDNGLSAMYSYKDADCIPSI